MLHSRKIATVCSLLLLSLCTACADDGDGDHGMRTDPVETDGGARPPPAPAPAPYDDVVELVVRNQTTRTVYKLFVSPSTDERWGPNVLQGRLLAPGGAATFQNDYCDAYYDLKAVDLSGNTIVRANRLYFSCGKRETVTLF